jgi:hypothetical protein
VNHTIQDGYIFNLNSGGGGGHPDFIQLDNQAGAGYWFKDILVQRVFIEGDTNAATGTDGAMGQIESGAFADPTRYTNVVFRNNIFKNVRGPFSDSVDGMKFYNNLFYRSPRDGGNVTAGGDADLVLTSITRSGTNATAILAAGHQLALKTDLFITGANETNFNRGLNTNVVNPPGWLGDIRSMTSTSFVYTVEDAGATTATGGPFLARGNRGSSYGTTFKNNIFYGGGLTDSDNVGWYYNDQVGSQHSGTTVIADYNHVSGITGNNKDEAAWTYNGQEANGVNGGIPLVVNEVGGDFRLTTNSASYLAGTNLSALFTTDYLGQSIPTNEWNIGPLSGAANSSGTPPPPSDTTPPTPNPATWSTVPTTVDYQSISMQVSLATDAENPPVQYRVIRDGAFAEGWQTSRDFTVSGLSPSTTYSFTCQARDSVGNATAESAAESATTDAAPPASGIDATVDLLNIAP